MNVTAWISQIVQGICYLSIAPLVLGILDQIRSRMQNRKGSGIFQVYRDLFNRFNKRPSVPEPSSWVFLAAPMIYFTCYAMLGFLDPVFYPFFQTTRPGSTIWSPSDLLLIVYLLGFARLVLG